MKLFLLCIFLTNFSFSGTLRGIIIADTVLIYDSPGIESQPVAFLSFGEAVEVMTFEPEQGMLEIHSTKNQDMTKGWIDKDDILMESATDYSLAYFISDSIRLHSQPTINSPQTAILPNKLQETEEAIFLQNTPIQQLDRENNWNYIKIDNHSGWISDSEYIPASYLSLIDSGGKELSKIPMGITGLSKGVQQQNSINFYDDQNLIIFELDSLKNSHRYTSTSFQHVEYCPADSLFLIDQSIRGNNRHGFISRIFMFDPVHFSVKKIVSTTSLFLRSDQYIGSPNQHTIFFMEEGSREQTLLIKTDMQLHLLDSLTIEDKSRYYSFLNEDTLLALIFKKTFPQVVTLAYIDVKNMQVVYEKEFTKHFILPELPNSLSFEKTIYWNRNYLFFGKFRLRGEEQDSWQNILWNTDTDTIQKIMFPDIQGYWDYTPFNIIDSTFIYVHSKRSGLFIQEFDLSSLKPLKTINISSPLRKFSIDKIQGKNFFVGGEGFGLYQDNIFKLSNGNYAIVYSHHGD